MLRACLAPYNGKFSHQPGGGTPVLGLGRASASWAPGIRNILGKPFGPFLCFHVELQINSDSFPSCQIQRCVTDLRKSTLPFQVNMLFTDFRWKTVLVNTETVNQTSPKAHHPLLLIFHHYATHARTHARARTHTHTHTLTHARTRAHTVLFFQYQLKPVFLSVSYLRKCFHIFHLLIVQNE